MKVSHSWLSEFVDLDAAGLTPDGIQRLLTDIGLEVEHVDMPAKALDRFVVGRVLSCERHPKADKLSVCTVDVGESEPRTIVCGAPNVAAGQTVAVALDGAIVPNGGFEIGRRTLRGVESNGMICSKAELGLGEDSDGIWVMSTDAPSGTPLAQALGIDDVIYDVAITPNRADCISHVGIARDLAAAATTPHTIQRSAALPHVPQGVSVRLADADLCSHYVAVSISGLKNGPSPEWIQRRITACGMRPRNLLVDVTNYVMLETGQPLHAFDARSVVDGIVVRRAGADTQFTTLDGKQRTLQPDMLMICTPSGPIGVAGVMGGEDSEIKDDTTEVVLESACFAPTSIRRTARLLGLNTDASYRFERGVDPEGIRHAAARAAALYMEYGGGTVTGVTDECPTPWTPITIEYHYADVQRFVGVSVTPEKIVEMFTALGCMVTNVQEHVCTVQPPSWRADIVTAIDLTEEVMRLNGIHNIVPATSATISWTQPLPTYVRAGGEKGPSFSRSLRRALAARGYAEAVTNVLCPPSGDEWQIRLQNALGLEFSAMRMSLLPGLAEAAARTLRFGASGVRMFEYGKVFRRDPSAEFGRTESDRLCAVVVGKTDEHWSAPQRPLDVYDVMGDVAAALRLAGVGDGRSLPANAMVGKLDPTLAKSLDLSVPVWFVEMDVRSLLPETRTFVPIGAYPAVRRDLAFVVAEEVLAAELLGVVRSAKTDLLRDVDVFDIYRDTSLGSGKKSVAVALTFRSDERTLVDAEVDAAVAEIVTITERSLGATVRRS